MFKVLLLIYQFKVITKVWSLVEQNEQLWMIKVFLTFKDSISNMSSSILVLNCKLISIWKPPISGTKI